MSGRKKNSGGNSVSKRKPIQIPEQLTGCHPIGRIIVDGRAYFDPMEGGKYLLNTLEKWWPENTKVDFLITPGGFICEKCSKKSGIKIAGWDSRDEDISKFRKLAENNVHKMLNVKNLLSSLKGKAKFIGIGSDIRFSDFRAEFVFLINVESEITEHWTGKSYPADRWEEKEVVLVNDMCTHFKEIDEYKILILGCHDLNMFIDRGRKDSKKISQRASRKKKINKCAKQFKPTIVLHHPHTTHSPQVWRPAWSSLKRRNKEVCVYASGISYFASEWKTYRPIEKVLKGTKIGKVFDILLRKSK